MVMKLPKQGPLQGVARPPSTARTQQLLQSNMQRENAELDQMFSSAMGVAMDIKKNHDLFESQSAYSNANTQMKMWEEENVNKEFYSADEIPEGVEVRRTENQIDDMGNSVEVLRENIPSYEVYPQMRRQQQKKIYEAQANTISAPEVRQQWSNKMNERALNENTQVAMQAGKVQNDQIRKSQQMEIHNSLMARDYESALFVANNYKGSDTERQNEINKVKYMAESDTYNQAMSEDDIPAMTSSLGYLQNDEYSGELNEPQRLATINQLKSHIHRLSARDEASKKASSNMLGYEIDATIRNIENGKDISADEIGRLADQISNGREAGILEGNAWEKRLFEFQTVVELQPNLNYFSTQDDLTRADSLREMRQSAETWEDHYKVDLFESADKKATKQLQDDSLAFAESTGVVEIPELEVNEVGLFTKETLTSRVRTAESVDAVYGAKTGANLFTNEEINIMAYNLSNANDDDKLRFVNNINSSLSKDQSQRVWSQLASTGNGEYAILGDMLSENQVNGARMLLTGASVIKNNPEVIKGWNGTHSSRMREILGNSFSASPETRAYISEGVKNVYAGLSMREHDMSGEYNDERMRRAIRTVAGSMYTVGGSTVPLPDRNMHPDTFDIFIRDLDVGYMDSLGGVQGFDTVSGNGDLKDQIQRGQIKLVATGKNKYVMYDANKRSYLRRKDNGQTFILRYDENADQRTRWTRGVHRIVEKF